MSENELDEELLKSSRSKISKTPKVEYRLWTEADLVAETMPPLGKETEIIVEWLMRSLIEKYPYEKGDNYLSFLTEAGQLIVYWRGSGKTVGELFFSVSKEKEDSAPIPYKRICVTLIREGKPAFVSQQMVENPFNPRLPSLVLAEEDLHKADKTDHFLIEVLVETNS